MEQDVENVGVRLFNLIEQHYGIRSPPDGLGELSAFFVSDVTRRRSDQTRDRVLLHIFAHIDANHCVLVVEEEFSQRAGEFGFSNSGWSEENKRADRAIRILQTGAGPTDGVRYGLTRRVLPNHSFVQVILESPFAFLQSRYRNSRPARNNLRDVFLRHFLAQQPQFLFGRGFEFF